MNDNKYYCIICDYIAPTCSNINSHYKTKRHLDNAVSKADNYNLLMQYLTNMNNRLVEFINQCDMNVMLTKNYDYIENELSKYVNNEIQFIAKIPNESHYLCTGCNQCFSRRTNYLKHIETCQQISTKYKLIKQSHIKTIIQTEKLKDICATIKDTFEQIKTDYNILESNHKNLENIFQNYTTKYQELKNDYEKVDFNVKQLKKENEELKKENDELKNNYLKLEKDYKDLEYNNKLNQEVNKQIKEYHNNQVKSQMYANTINNNSINNFNINIILSETPPFKYINPFIDPNTNMPHRYDCPQERLILADNIDATIEIKSSLCNAIAFQESHLQNELVDFVARCIVNTYQNDDHTKQTFWSTDITRGSYYVRLEGENNNKNYWQKDKEGEYLKKNLINPLAAYICKTVNFLKIYKTQKYICGYVKFDYSIPIAPEISTAYNSVMKNLNQEMPEYERNKFKQFFTRLDDLCCLAQDSNFKKRVLNKIAGKFYLDKHKYLNEYRKIDDNKNVNDNNEEKSDLLKKS